MGAVGMVTAAIVPAATAAAPTGGHRAACAGRCVQAGDAASRARCPAARTPADRRTPWTRRSILVMLIGAAAVGQLAALAILRRERMPTAGRAREPVRGQHRGA